MAITRSGVHKGFLSPRDIIAVDFDGRSLIPGSSRAPRRCCHCQIYRLWPEVGAVVAWPFGAATAINFALPEAAAIDFEATRS